MSNGRDGDGEMEGEVSGDSDHHLISDYKITSICRSW